MGGGKKASSSSSNVRPAGKPLVSADQRRKSDGDKIEALWRRAFDPDTLIPLQQYATSSTFEDPGNKRTLRRSIIGGACIWPSVAPEVYMCPMYLLCARTGIWRL